VPALDVIVTLVWLQSMEEQVGSRGAHHPSALDKFHSQALAQTLEGFNNATQSFKAEKAHSLHDSKLKVLLLNSLKTLSATSDGDGTWVYRWTSVRC
jgi:hypothetical protein